MTPTSVHIEKMLQQLSELTSSDLTAIGVVDPLTRKFQWQLIVGSISNRTEKIKQHIHSGLTGDVLRTGSFLQLKTVKGQISDNGEAIMLTEKLKHIAVWPISYSQGHYRAAILIGKRQEGWYELEQIHAAASLIHELDQICIHL